MVLKVTDIINGRYRVLKELEEGGFGKVFIAEDLLKFSSKCIVKQFVQHYDEESAKAKKARQLFQTEANILHDLEIYPQVPNLLAFVEEQDCIVQQLVDGENLAKKVEAGAFNEDQVLDLLMQILPVLAKIHDKSIFHRDIKPENILYDKQSNQFFLIDFGIAKQVSELDNVVLTDSGLVTPRSTYLGTDGYRPPDSYSSPSGDLYSLGATCFYLLTGYHPEYADERSWINVAMQVRTETDKILKKLFEEDTSKRYQDARQVLQDIKKIENIRRNERIAFLLSLLTSEENRYREQAIQDLAEFGSDASNAIPYLIDILKDEGDYQLQSSAIDTLVQIGEESVPSVAQLLEHDDVEVRRRASRTLEQIGSLAKAAIPQLINALEDKDPEGDVRWYAAITIGKIGLPAKNAIPALVKRLEDPKVGIRAWSLYALGKMGSLAKEATPAILEILNQEKNLEQSVFIAAIEALNSIGFNIDEININIEKDKTTMTAREWVVEAREICLKAKREAKKRKGILLNWRRPLSADTPPQKDLSQFRDPNYSN